MILTPLQKLTNHFTYVIESEYKCEMYLMNRPLHDAVQLFTCLFTLRRSFFPSWLD